MPLRKIEIANEENNIVNHAMQPYFDTSLDWNSDVAKMLKIISIKYNIDKICIVKKMSIFQMEKSFFNF